MKTRRQYDDEFKKMAVDLSEAKGSLKATAEELGITPKSSPDGVENERLLKPFLELVAEPKATESSKKFYSSKSSLFPLG